MVLLVHSVADPDPHLDLDPYVFGPPGSPSVSVSKRYGSEDLHPHPDLYQNVADLQHCSYSRQKNISFSFFL
jgi:hypothetical protein